MGGVYITGKGSAAIRGASSRSSQKASVDGWQNTGKKSYRSAQAGGNNQTTIKTSSRDIKNNQQQKSRSKTGSSVEAPSATSRSDAVKQSATKSSTGDKGDKS